MTSWTRAVTATTSSDERWALIAESSRLVASAVVMFEPSLFEGREEAVRCRRVLSAGRNVPSLLDVLLHRRHAQLELEPVGVVLGAPLLYLRRVAHDQAVRALAEPGGSGQVLHRAALGLPGKVCLNLAPELVAPSPFHRSGLGVNLGAHRISLG